MTKPPTKPGIQTTEFWVHNVLQITTLITAALGNIAPTAALWVSAVLGSVYIVARSIVKVVDGGGSAVADPASVKSLSFAILVMGFLSLCGCGVFATPTPLTSQDQAIAQVTRAQEAYLVAVTTINALHASGKISDSAMKTLVPIEETVWTYLQAASAAAEAGKTVDAATQLQLFNDALMRLNAGYGAPPASAPSTAPSPTPATAPASQGSGYGIQGAGYVFNTSTRIDRTFLDWRVRTPAGNALEAIAAHWVLRKRPGAI